MSGEFADRNVFAPAISGDGRHVAFFTGATNLGGGARAGDNMYRATFPSPSRP